MKDLLVGIFADSTVPEQLRKPSLSSVQPSFVEYGDGLVLAKGFDMDRALQDYEETLQDMLENGGFANPAVGQICAGLASLYDAKAGISKDAKFYDRAVEYIAMMQQAMQDPTFLHLEGRKQKILRKKQRRLAKGPPGPELQQLLNQRPERRKE
ncbi:unnamed protein product [Effrenium voratum]|uniref:Uncharacterized protein n=1 Tax=Effrenium voratum TaxID=2562239 RepID=A0AA36HUX4_9DINO|nr:unnamed protein product [Effrenium voratum]CAJ1375250.1 unnamed protein product [Effrenium voratum]